MLGRVTTIGGVTGNVDRSTFYGLADRDFRDSSTDQATLRAEHDFGGVTLRNTARWSRNTQEYSFLLPDDSQGNVFGTAATNPTTGAAATRGDVLTGGYVWRRANPRYGYADSLVDQTDLYGTVETAASSTASRSGSSSPGRRRAAARLVLSTDRRSARAATPRRSRASICTSLFNPNPYDPW
ncbi:MAG: hypothetical protein WDN44_05090 [Sphingomonas sp.]